MNEELKTRLKRLFAVAENDASCDGEINNAMLAAKNIMDQHQISREDVRETEDGVDTTNVVYADNCRYSMYTSICAWESLLCKFVTQFVPGAGYYISRGQIRRNTAGMASNKTATKIIFYGPREDVVFCCEIWDEVNLFIQAAARLHYGKALARGKAASYAEGFAEALYEANKEEVEKMEDESTSDCHALVVVNRSLAIRKGGKEWLASKGVNLRKGLGPRSAAGKSEGAYNQGKADGGSYQPAAQKRAGYLT